MKQLLRNMWRDDDGQDIVEYALIAGLVSIVAFTLIQGAGTSIKTIWTSISTDLSTAAGS